MTIIIVIHIDDMRSLHISSFFVVLQTRTTHAVKGSLIDAAKYIASSTQNRSSTMTTSLNIPTTKTIILVGLIGCFLTSVAGVSGAMLVSGWEQSGGWSEWVKRLGLGYPCACLVVLSVFPRMVPKMTRFLEKR